MYAILSPAKTLDFSKTDFAFEARDPLLMEDTKALIDVMKEKSQNDIAELMSVSDKLAELNHTRYQNFFKQDKKAAILAFQGDVYKGLEARTLDKDQLLYADKHIGILSGLYGLLRPLDDMRAYRLEMGTRLETERGKNLYEFWGDKVTNRVNQVMRETNAPALVNLASNEYADVINKDAIERDVLDIVFKDIKPGGKPKIISFYAKKARGLMARYMVEKEVKSLQELRGFDKEGYYFVGEESDDQSLVFHRKLDK